MARNTTAPIAASTYRCGVCVAFSKPTRPRRVSFKRCADAATCSCRMANSMRRPIDSLFGRLALLVIAVLLLSHFAWYALMRLERGQLQTRYAVEEATFLIDAVRQHVARTPDQPLPSRVKLVDPASPEVPPETVADMPPALERFVEDVRDRMPSGTQVRVHQ